MFGNKAAKKLIDAITHNASDFDVQALIKTAHNLDWQDSIGNTALMYACAYNRATMADMLIKSNCNTDLMNDYGNTALHIAIIENHMLLAERLATSLNNINAVNEAGDTAMSGVVSILLKKGANPNHVNTNGDTALIFAVNAESTDMVSALKSAGADTRVLNEAEHEIMETLIEGAGPYYKDDDHSVEKYEGDDEDGNELSTVFNFKSKTITRYAGETAVSMPSPFRKAFEKEIMAAYNWGVDNGMNLERPNFGGPGNKSPSL